MMTGLSLVPGLHGLLALLLLLAAGRDVMSRIIPNGLTLANRIDGLFLERAITKVTERLSVLSAEAPISEPVISDGTGYCLLQEEVRTAFECTIVDLPRSLLIYHPELAAQTHHIVLVAELTLAAARDVFRLAAWLKGAAPQTQISVALNKVPAGTAAEITKKDFETAIERKVDFIIPEDAKSARHAAKLGKALTAASLLSGITACALVIAIYIAATSGNAMTRRIKALQGRRDELKAEMQAHAQKRKSRIAPKDRRAEQLRALLDRMKLLQDEQLKAAQLKLTQAGIRTKDWAVAVILARAVLPIVLGSLAVVMIYLLDHWPDMSPLSRFMWTAGALIAGYKGPDVFIQNSITKRLEAIRLGLPDALDLLVICAEAGLTVDAAFSRTARELGSAYPELADEFGLTAVEIGFLTDRRQAFLNLAARIPLESIKGVATTMIQTEKYGTPLASALRVLSAEFRNERMMRAEAKAARLPAIMTVPLILFVLPALFIIILGPAACSIMDTLK
ncbi:MAG: hypothetical protein RJB22_2016 [Pseudomonadota bacterium]